MDNFFTFRIGGILMKSRVLNATFAGLLSLTLVAGCAKKSNNDSSHPANMLRIDVGSEVPTLDPTLGQDNVSARISYDLFEGLVSFDQQNNVVPGLAYKWKISADGKTYTFYLRDNLKFSDGSPITSADVVYSLRRLSDPKTASPYIWLIANVVNADAIGKGKLSASDLGVTAPNATTVVINLVNPDQSFLQALTLPNAAIVPQKVIAKYGQEWIDPSHIVTSGAYMVKEHVVNGYVLAQKNPYYYDAKHVKIAQVKYLPDEDKNTSIPTYEAGGLDMTWQQVPVDQYQQMQKDYPKQLHTVLQEALYFYDFNFKDPKLAGNKKLRQALSMAVDRTILTDYVLKEGQKPLYSLATATIENGAYASVAYPWAKWPRAQQIAEAKKLYQESGYGTNNPLTITISYNTNDQHKKVALAVASMWKSVLGVNVVLQNEEWKTFIQTRAGGNYEIARDGWVADFNSVTAYTPLYQCNSGANNEQYCNPKYDALIAQATKTFNPEVRKQLYTQALTYAMDDYPTIPLFQYTYTRLVEPYVEGYKIDKNYLDHVQSKWISFK